MATPLRIGYLSTLYHTSHLLRELGWLDRELGIQARWLLFGTGPEMVRAFGAREIDLGYIGLPPAMIGMSRGLPLVCVAGGHVEGTVVVAGRGHHRMPEDPDGGEGGALRRFSGHAVGIPAAGSIHDVIFRDLLDAHAVTGVEVRNVAWADLIPRALRRGEIAGAVGTPPLAVLCEREGVARIAIPPDRLWPFNPSYGILACRDLLDEGATLLEGFVGLHEACCNLIRQDPLRAAEVTCRALPGLDPDLVSRTYAVSPCYCASLPEPYVEATLAFLPALQRMGYLHGPVEAEAVFERELAARVHPRPHHYRSQVQ